MNTLVARVCIKGWKIMSVPLWTGVQRSGSCGDTEVLGRSACRPLLLPLHPWPHYFSTDTQFLFVSRLKQNWLFTFESSKYTSQVVWFLLCHLPYYISTFVKLFRHKKFLECWHHFHFLLSLEHQPRSPTSSPHSSLTWLHPLYISTAPGPWMLWTRPLETNNLWPLFTSTAWSSATLFHGWTKFLEPFLT